MNVELAAMLDYLERERGIKREILLEALSTALLSASKKSVGAARDLRIEIDPKTCDIRALAKLIVANSRMQARLYKLLNSGQQKKLADFKRASDPLIASR